MDAQVEIVKRRPGRQPGFSPVRAAAEREAAQAHGIARETLKSYPVHRFGLPDLETMGAWLVERLRVRYPHLPEHYIAPWLRGAMETNDNLFIRTTDTVLLARRNQQALDNQPYVEEVFCFIRNGAEAEAPSLYAMLKNWSTGLSATEIRVDYNSDLSLDMIETTIGETELWQYSALKLVARVV